MCKYAEARKRGAEWDVGSAWKGLECGASGGQGGGAQPGRGLHTGPGAATGGLHRGRCDECCMSSWSSRQQARVAPDSSRGQQLAEHASS